MPEPATPAQLEIERLRADLRRVEAQLAGVQRQKRELTLDAAAPPSIVGTSAPMLAMKAAIDAVAPTGATVLILGETGSGKELVARAVHAASPRAEAPFIAVNCAALPESLIESELFGHERGAFTGADRRRSGKFEVASPGTLFLDEVAELSLQGQAKLLRVLQESTFERVGGSETVRVDVRIVAATHRDLSAQVRRGRFREDLFYRLNVFRIEVPPLRDRREDIRQLVEHLHAHHARRMARPMLPISDRSLRRLLSYRWPGNVRELEHAVERATLLCAANGSPQLEIDPPSDAPLPPGAQSSKANAPTSHRDVLLDLTLDELQRLQIVHALEACAYKVYGDSGAAQRLGIKPQTLLSRMDKLGIPRPRAARRAIVDQGNA